MQLSHELAQVMSPQQIQGLQSLISLAQSNPALLSQLTTDVFNNYHQNNPHSTNSNNNPTSAPATPSTKQNYEHFSQPSYDSNTIASSLYSMLQPQISQQPFNAGTNRYPTTTNRGIMPAAIQPRPTTAEPIPANYIYSPTVAPSPQSVTPFTTPASNTVILSNDSTPSSFIGSYLSPTTSDSNIDTLTRTADDINSDIDTLGSNIEALAQQLGFDPTKANDDLLGYVDMDKFLQAYGKWMSPQKRSAYHWRIPLFIEDANVYPEDTVHQAGPASPSTEPTDKNA